MTTEPVSMLGLMAPLVARAQENSGDDVFVLLALMAAMAFGAGAIEFFQGRLGKRFPIPLILYCHLLPMIGFVYVMLPVSDYVDGEPADRDPAVPVSDGPAPAAPISPWPLYAALAPLPFVLAGRFLLPKVEAKKTLASS